MSSRSLFVNGGVHDETLRREINALRIQEYGKASGFSLNLDTLNWGQSDSQSYVIAAQDGDQLVATMRGEIVDDLGLLEKKLECPWSFNICLDFPVLLLSRAATANTHRSAGLNLALRYWFLRLAIEHQIQWIIGTFVLGSPRERTLREMGYRFFENKAGWTQSSYRSTSPVAVVALDIRSKGQQALDYCLAKAPDAIREFDLKGPYPEFRTVKGL